VDERDPHAEEGASCPYSACDLSRTLSAAEQIMDLEARLSQASEELAQVAHLGAGGGGGAGGKRANREWVPSAPARHTFSGHRLAVNALAFHPTFSSLATASEDTTIKVWDWESGELERTLKGHTKSVTDCQYDSKGKLLGLLLESAACAPDPDLTQRPAPMTSSSSSGRSTKITKIRRHSVDTSTPYLPSALCRETIDWSVPAGTRPCAYGKSRHRRWLSTLASR
jgi:hypothetical protein